MARDNIEIDKIFKLKPQASDLLYPTLRGYEDEYQGESENEARHREQRNERRRVNFEYECKVIETNGAFVDRIPWDEAVTKTKSLIYLSFCYSLELSYLNCIRLAGINK